VTRLEYAYANRTVKTDEIMIEDALDIINYATFFVKQIERGMNG
jgi:hypothetical protein